MAGGGPGNAERSRSTIFFAVEIHRQSTVIGAREDRGGQTYRVRLLSGDNEVELANVSNYLKARGTAKEVANFTGLPLHKATEGQTVVR